MSESDTKGSLPYGWIVRTSKQYKNRIYYFNINTGASTWECPELDPPCSESKEQQKNMECLNVDQSKKLNGGCSSTAGNNKIRKQEVQFSSSESKTPPTAVVVPVVHKNNSVIIDKKDKPKRKLRIENVTPMQNKRKRSENIIEKKKILPPNRSNNSEDTVPLDATGKNKNSSSRKKVSSPTTSFEISKDIIKDVEMRDVSVDLIDDLTAMKDTVFDTTACYYIVVDTNVLISELPLISELKDTPLDGCGPPHIFIPWIVIEELDKLKNQRNQKIVSRGAAAEAVRYLNSVLSTHPRFHGQSPTQAEEWSKSYSKNNDDKILECCIGLMDKMPPEKVILLTNDKNLVNKALICKVNVHNFESMMKKVKPDTIFNYEELKNGKKKKKGKEKKPENASAGISEDVAEERFLRNTRDTYKCEIHTLMSNARLLLKDVLSKFLEVEMFEAYGSVWTSFPIEKKLLKGILEGIKKYWRMVFSEFFSEKEQRNFELLLEKASRPEGYLGDKDDCLVILSTIEDVFRQVKKRRPTIRSSVEEIKEYRIACVNAFASYTEVESSLRIYEEKSILELFNADWVAMNQLTGLILDYYNVPNSFNYIKFNGLLPEAEVERILISLYPEVKRIKTLMCNLLDAVKNCKPTAAYSRKLANTLLQFIPSLRVPHEPATYQFFSAKALERFFTSTQHREKIEIGIKQVEKFYEKLDEVLYDMLKGNLKSPVAETSMMCD